MADSMSASRRLFRNTFAALALTCLFPQGSAHDIFRHGPPLDIAAVERVTISLQALFGELRRTGVLAQVRLPEGALNLAALLGPLEEAIALTDNTSVGDSPTLQRALRDAGYAASPLMIYEWRSEARETLIAYEQLQALPAQEVHDGDLVELFAPELGALLEQVQPR
jgi:hypothetical protein